MPAALLSETYLSTVQFSDHTLTTPSELVGFEALRLATGRRHRVTNRWRSGAGENVETDITVTFDRVRSFDGLALDRGHNLAGQIVVVEASDDAFSTALTAFSGVVPATAGGTLDGAGAVTPEGAWLLRFSLVAAKAVRLRIPAATGLTPEAVGLMIGRWYDIEFLDRPWADESAQLLAQESVTPYGWSGTGARNSRRQGTLHIRLSDYAEYERARYHIQQRFHDEYSPAWVVMDTAAAYRAVLAKAIPGAALGFELAGRDWAYRQAAVNFIEHEPALP